MAAVVHGPVVVRRRLGAVLKRLRGEVGLHLDAVARRLEISPSKLSRLETGQVTPKIRDVRDLLEIYQAPNDLRDRLMRWASEAKEPAWWQPFSSASPYDLDYYVSLEVEARSLHMFSSPIPGLLQTEEYARRLLTGAFPHCTADELNGLVEIRVGRQVFLDPEREEAPPLDFHVVVDEAGLRRGRADVLPDQLRVLLTRARWPNVHLQVLPFDAGFTEAVSTFAIFEPRDPADRTVVSVESTGQDAYFETPGEVARYRGMWALTSEAALDPDESVALIEQILRS